MLKVRYETAPGCAACRTGLDLDFELTMAFQPLVDIRSGQVRAYEALVRGTEGQSAGEVLQRVHDGNRYIFDQTCRVKAIELAARLGIDRQGAKLSVNFMPGAVYSPAACIQRTLQAAEEFQFPLASIIFEITENERMGDIRHMQRIASEYKRHGFTLALDDFGAGFSGLNLLSELEAVEMVKLDGALIRSIDTNARAQQIVGAIVDLCGSLGVEVLAECVETTAECLTLSGLGISMMQGYLFAKPAVQELPAVRWPEAAA